MIFIRVNGIRLNVNQIERYYAQDENLSIISIGERHLSFTITIDEIDAKIKEAVEEHYRLKGEMQEEGKQEARQ